MKLPIVQVSPFSLYFIPVRSKYFPQHPVTIFVILPVTFGLVYLLNIRGQAAVLSRRLPTNIRPCFYFCIMRVAQQLVCRVKAVSSVLSCLVLF
jgi:hypothetical protein